jgi:hypothetical protein
MEEKGEIGDEEREDELLLEMKDSERERPIEEGRFLTKDCNSSVEKE